METAMMTSTANAKTPDTLHKSEQQFIANSDCMSLHVTAPSGVQIQTPQNHTHQVHAAKQKQAAQIMHAW